MNVIEFGKLQIMLLDFVDGPGSDGCFFLRMVGEEGSVGAIWARLSARETRGKSYNSGVSIPVAGRSYPEYVALQKERYTTIRTRLPSGLVDLALIHPALTISEDTEFGFYILTYETGVPSGFFDRLNRSLSIPIKPEWESWLWAAGQQAVSRFMLETKKVSTGGEETEETILKETTEICINQLKSRGTVGCYRVATGGRYRDAWLHTIREQLELETYMAKPSCDSSQYACFPWKIAQLGTGEEAWKLYEADELVFSAPTLNYLLALARRDLGLNLVIAGGG